MGSYKLKSNQLGPYCSFCPPKTERAVYRQENWRGDFACREHKDLLENSDDNDHLTEADYQTWRRL